MYAALGYGTQTSQRFWGHDDTETGGVLGVFVDGVLTTGATLAAGNDYCGTVDVTGLSAGEHSYQLALDGVAVGNAGTFSTAPASGESFDLIFCGDARVSGSVMALMTARENPAAIFASELCYIEGYYTLSGPTEAEYLAEWRAGYRDILTDRARRDWMAKFQVRSMWDNHEIGPGVGWPAPGEAMFDAARQAFLEYEGAGNPPNTDADIDASALYFSEVIGDVEIIVLDGSSYSQNSGGGYLVDETRGGTQQANWAARKITESAANLIILHSPKESPGSDTASWGIIFAAIEAVAPKQVILCEADTHCPYARKTWRLGQTEANGILSVGVSPLAQTTSKTITDTHPRDLFYFLDDTARSAPWTDLYTNQANLNWVYCRVSRRPNGSSERAVPHTKVEIINALTGVSRWHCWLDDGVRGPILPNTSASGVPR